MVLDFTFGGSGCDRCTLDCFQSSMPSPTQTYIMKDSDKYKSCCLEEVFTNLAENFYNCKRTFYQKKTATTTPANSTLVNTKDHMTFQLFSELYTITFK